MNYSDFQKYPAIDFFLSMSCNRSCYYCTSYTIEMRHLTVDMEFLRQTLSYLKDYKVRINLLGGEPGLIKNLDEVVAEIKSHDNLICSVLSNSYVRKKYPEILDDPEIFYLEHLVLDFHEDRIEKLGNFDFFDKNDKNNYNIVIKTPNFDKYKNNFPEEIEKLTHENTRFKKYNSRSPEFGLLSQSAEIDRKMCSAFPQVPVIDFEKRNIRHCSKRTLDSKTFDLTKDNIDKMMRFDLFKYEEYCQKCYEYINPKGHFQLIKYLEVLND